jgi:hypothetical protein
MAALKPKAKAKAKARAKAKAKAKPKPQQDAGVLDAEEESDVWVQCDACTTWRLLPSSLRIPQEGESWSPLLSRCAFWWYAP